MTEIPAVNWRTARAGGACAEAGQDGAVAVRDTADRSGSVLTFGTAAWRAFTGGLRDGRGAKNRVFTDGS